MPTLSALLVRSALVWLALGAATGALLLAGKATPLPGGVAHLFQFHMEAMLFGWMVQLAMGVAWWILPRYPTLPERGPAAPVVAVWALLNAGVLVAGLARSAALPDAVAMGGRVAECLAAVLFLAVAWPRVKAFGK